MITNNALGVSIVNPFDRSLYFFWQIAGGVIQQIVVPALSHIVARIAEPGPHPVTVIVPGDTGKPGQITASVIDGGGHDPGPDEPPPPPPPAPTEHSDTCVAVHYRDAQSRPFIVRKVLDVGDDPQYGEHKILLDGVTPVWGQWIPSGDCGRQFEVDKTQTLPGVDVPKQVPIPGYPVELVSDSHSTNFPLWVVVALLIIAALILAAVLKPDPPNPPDPPQIHAEARAGGPPEITARETPAAGEATHAIRLETHPDEGLVIVEDG